MNHTYLIDTHCHVHESSYPLDSGDALVRAHHAGVKQLICVGTNEQSSREAVVFAGNHEQVYAAVGVHPHDAKEGWGGVGELLLGSKQASKIVAVGEIGLDYFYTHSPREVQIAALEQQLQWALDAGLPVIFHVREASSAERRYSVWHDFWPIFDNFHGIRGELHSFTDTAANLEAGLTRGLSIGVNGISTFTRDEAQKQLFAAIPLNRLLLETDAPFLTPVPHRGTVNEPAFVREVAEHMARLRDVSFNEVAAQTSHNAHTLFSL